MHTNDKTPSKSHINEQFKGLNKKRTQHMMQEEVFQAVSSKHDLYKHLDQHLQVSTDISYF